MSIATKRQRVANLPEADYQAWTADGAGDGEAGCVTELIGGGRMLDIEQAVKIAKALGTRELCGCEPARLVWTIYGWDHRFGAVCYAVLWKGCPYGCGARLLPEGWLLPEDWRERLAALLVERAQGIKSAYGIIYPTGLGMWLHPAKLQRPDENWPRWTVGLGTDGEPHPEETSGPTQDEALYSLLVESERWTPKESGSDDDLG